MAKDAVDRWGHDGVVAALEVAAAVPDEKLAARARARLDALGATPVAVDAPPAARLWEARPAPYSPVAVEEIRPAEPDIVAASSVYNDQAGLVDDALLLDAVVRWAARDPGAAQRFVAEVDTRTPYERPRSIMALGHARYAGARLELARRIRHLEEVHDGRPRTRSYAEPILQAIVGIQLTETGLRLGQVPLLLSTPTSSDGAVSFDALVDRMRRHAGIPVGTFDLFLALLRVGPIPPERLGELDALDGVDLPLEAPVPRRDTFLGRLRGRRQPGDAAELVRRWVQGGGLPPLTAGREADGTLTVDPIRLPVELGAFPGVPEGILAGHASDRGYWVSWASAAGQVAAAPWWPELLAAQSLRLFDQSSRAVASWLLPPLVTSPGWTGPAVHRTVVATLSHADEDERLIGVDAFLTLAGRDDFDTGLITSACLDLLARGELRLTRTAGAWEQVVLGGGMRALWPSVVAVAEAACAMPRKPAGLADLVAFYGRYAGADPGAVVPPALAALAADRGGSKAHLEARRALERLAGSVAR
jgi:hypothetical protein